LPASADTIDIDTNKFSYDRINNKNIGIIVLASFGGNYENKEMAKTALDYP
jgi:hypothetical protein